MPIDSVGLPYQNRTKAWLLLKDIMAGEEAIKRKGTEYVPQLGTQDAVSYKSYLNRGYLYNATDRTRSGLLGAIMRKPANWSVPDVLMPYMNQITIDDLSFDVLISNVSNENLSTGFLLLYADCQATVDGKPKPYVSVYTALDIINCQTAIIGGREQLIWLTVREIVHVPNVDDPYTLDSIEQIREFTLTQNGLIVQVYRMGEKEWEKVGDPLEPTRFGGKRMDIIPCTFIGAVNNSKNPPKPPLLDLAYANIKHFQVSCDYYHGLHYCAIPTPFAFGFSLASGLSVGPEMALVSTNENAKCGYMEFTGQGLKSVREALNDMKMEMSILGARILEEQKRVGESAEALILRGRGDSATLSTIVNSNEEGLKKIVHYLCYWLNYEVDPDEVNLKLNKDFISARLNSQDFMVLIQALQAGKISVDTFLYNLQVGEILPEERTIDQEKILIEKDTENIVSIDVVPGKGKKGKVKGGGSETGTQNIQKGKTQNSRTAGSASD
jgi:hypothetical protein